jgi:hypothetical protein
MLVSMDGVLVRHRYLGVVVVLIVNDAPFNLIALRPRPMAVRNEARLSGIGARRAHDRQNPAGYAPIRAGSLPDNGAMWHCT